jgi:hypothetical protein
LNEELTKNSSKYGTAPRGEVFIGFNEVHQPTKIMCNRYVDNKCDLFEDQNYMYSQWKDLK